MYAHRIPFTRDTNKGPQPADKPAKKASTKPVAEEPAKIEDEPIDLIIEPQAEEITEEPTDGNA
jgi:hypothetical protein